MFLPDLKLMKGIRNSCHRGYIRILVLRVLACAPVHTRGGRAEALRIHACGSTGETRAAPCCTAVILLVCTHCTSTLHLPLWPRLKEQCGTAIRDHHCCWQQCYRHHECSCLLAAMPLLAATKDRPRASGTGGPHVPEPTQSLAALLPAPIATICSVV